MIRDRNLVAVEFCRYLIVGGLAFGCDFFAYLGLTEFADWNYLLANVIGFCLGLTVNYLLSIFWVFQQRSESSVKKEFVLFAGIGLFNLCLGEFALWAMVAMGDIHHIAAKIAITALVFLSNFFMRKVMLFNVQPT